MILSAKNIVKPFYGRFGVFMWCDGCRDQDHVVSLDQAHYFIPSVHGKVCSLCSSSFATELLLLLALFQSQEYLTL